MTAVQAVDLAGLRPASLQELLAAKVMQSVESYSRDFLTSISFPRQLAEYRVCHLLHNETTRCHITGKVS